MTHKIAKIDYADEIASLGNRAGQLVVELTAMPDDLKYVAPAVEQLKALAKEFRPAPESHDLVRVNANVKQENPIEELDVLLRKIRLAAENLGRAAELLAERRSAIDALLR